jgi:ribosome-binding factor A
MSKGELKTPSQRQLRVGEELRHALAHILERGEVHDPGLAGVSVTVTEVRVSPDLRNATAFIMPLGGGDDADADAVEALTRAKGFIRRRLAEMVRLRVTPAFSFRLDGSFDEAGHIEDLLRRPEVARDLVSGDEGSPAAESAAPPHDESHGHG